MVLKDSSSLLHTAARAVSEQEDKQEEEESGVMWSGNKFLAVRESDRELGGQREFCVIGIRQTVRQAEGGR